MNKRLRLIQKFMPEIGCGENTLENDFDKYLMLARNWNGIDVQEFWRNNANTIPALFNIAQTTLSLSSTSSICENAFSVAGLVVYKQASLINPMRVKRKLFVHDNYKKTC